tara:strand:+ start:1795 stop:2160 length:366 start_codon:yes stop_codon:yes gene_type:complete
MKKKITICSVTNDLEITSKLAKICNNYGYNLQLLDGIELINNLNEITILILQIDNSKNYIEKKIKSINTSHKISIISYTDTINNKLIQHYKKIGCSLILRRSELLRNIHSILIKIIENEKL